MLNAPPDAGVVQWVRSGWAKVPREISEVLINHAPPVLDEIYDRYDRLDEKRDALKKYEEWLASVIR
jgi:hypothetical protein